VEAKKAHAGRDKGRRFERCGKIFPVHALALAVVLAVSCNDEEVDHSPSPRPAGFVTGMDADLMLSGIDFNDSGGPLLFNHPGQVAGDGTRLLLPDRNNNRVLVWNSPPAANEPPDLVLGQPDFNANDSGTTMDRLNWPISAATDGERVVVADTNNNRVLVWRTFPVTNGQSADFALEADWPWGVWTDGTRLAVSATRTGIVLIWHHFPESADALPDLELTAQGMIGTPRTITSDGTMLIIGDHNPAPEVSPDGVRGNFFWTSFPTWLDQDPDFFMQDPYDPARAIMQGTFTDDGKLIMLGAELYVWNKPPSSADDAPDMTIPESIYSFAGGDGSGVVQAGSTLFASLSNGNKLVAWEPFSSNMPREPDFAVGAPDPETNTFQTHHFITNPRPATDGQHLFVSSDFDKELHVWTSIPETSGVPPDGVVALPQDSSPWSITLYDGQIALVGGSMLLAWRTLPLQGQDPDVRYEGTLGGVDLNEVRGIAWGPKGFFLSDQAHDRIYVWEDLPDVSTPPQFVVHVDSPVRISCDDTYLVATCTETHTIALIELDTLVEDLPPITFGVSSQGNLFNRPEDAIVAHGHLFVADTGFNRVLVWNRIEDAPAGMPPDAILGQPDAVHTEPATARNRLFWPAALAYDGRYLWVGEYKFSGRLLRFSG